MISSSVLLPFLIIQLSVAFSPGLIIALVVNQSVQHSRRKGFEVALGAATGAIGGDLSHEFQIIAKTGESELAYDPELVSQNLLNKSYEEITSMYSASDEMIDKNRSNVVIGRGIEVGHIFNFGTKYSLPLECYVLNNEGKKVTPHMGSYGVGVSRLTAAIIEAFHDEIYDEFYDKSKFLILGVVRYAFLRKSSS